MDRLAQAGFDPAPLLLLQAGPPADAGGVVVGAGIDHPVRALVVGWQVGVIRIAIEGELEDLHPRQLEVVAQGFNAGGDHAQVFGHQGHHRAATGLEDPPP